MPTPAPEPVAAFLDSAVAAALPAAIRYSVPAHAALTIDARSTPDLCTTWMPTPAAEPVAAFLNSAVPAALPAAIRYSVPAHAALTIDARSTPDPCTAWMPTPSPEPVAAFLSSAVAPALPAAIRYSVPAHAGLTIDARSTPDLCTAWMPTPAAEPLAAFLSSAFAAPIPATVPTALPALDLAAELEPLPVPDAPTVCTAWMPTPAAEPVAAFLSSASAAPIQTTVPTALPALDVAAELEPLPVPKAPTPCAAWMPTPSPEPVWSFLQSSTAAELWSALPYAAPALDATVAAPHVPAATALREIPNAEPVMAGVWPRLADTLSGQLGDTHTLCLPALTNADLAPKQLSAPAPILVPAQAPAAAAHIQAVPNQAAEAQVAEPLLPAAPFTVPFFTAPQTSHALSMPTNADIAPAVAEPPPVERQAVAPQPIQTVRVTAPVQRHVHHKPAITLAGAVALEYHTQQMRSAPYSRPEWKSVCFEPLAPRLTLRPVLDRLEDVLKPAPAPAGIFRMSAPRRSYNPAVQYAFRAAAAVLIVTTVWLSVSGIKTRRLSAQRADDSSFATPNRVLTAESQAHNPKPGQARGPITWVRQTLANRASLQVADDFQHGMKNWGAQAAAYPAGWQRHPEGYVQTGALAILTPTVKFADYRLEFFGQIESKSMGWAVRAADSKNYHAMKFTVMSRRPPAHHRDGALQRSERQAGPHDPDAAERDGAQQHAPSRSRWTYAAITSSPRSTAKRWTPLSMTRFPPAAWASSATLANAPASIGRASPGMTTGWAMCAPSFPEANRKPPPNFGRPLCPAARPDP